MHIDPQVLVVALLASAMLGFNIALAWAHWNLKREQRRNELVR